MLTGRIASPGGEDEDALCVLYLRLYEASVAA